MNFVEQHQPNRENGSGYLPGPKFGARSPGGNLARTSEI
jgi:hypothetical protein